MKFLGTSLFLLLVSALIGNAQAACGGGGWHSSPSVSTTTSSTSSRDTAIVSTSESRHVVATSAAPSNEAPTFSTRFDGVAPRMGLSQKQANKIEDAKEQIREDLQDLKHDVTKAERRLSRCEGNCDDEKKALNRATEAQRNFSPAAEFERRLQAILNQDQLATFHEADAASTSR